MHCEGPKEDIVPDSYFILLHWGYSLTEHKQIVGEAVDLDALIEHIFEGTVHFGLSYSIELDETALDVVRSEWGVDMVECDQWVHLID